MSDRYKLLVVGLLLALAFYLGDAYGLKSVSTDKTEQQVVDDKKTHTVTQIVKQKDGTVNTTIVTDKVERKDSVKSTSAFKPAVKPKYNVSLYAGVKNLNLENPIYGLSVSKEFIGPITLGAFGLTDGTFGAIVGFNF